jgi:hypothetical protein
MSLYQIRNSDNEEPFDHAGLPDDPGETQVKHDTPDVELNKIL